MASVIDVLVFRVGQPAVIEKTATTLDAMREKIGGGYVRIVELAGTGRAGLLLYCDDDGLLKNLPRNRDVPSVYRIQPGFIVGDFFICGFTKRRGIDVSSITAAEARVQIALWDPPTTVATVPVADHEIVCDQCGRTAKVHRDPTGWQGLPPGWFAAAQPSDTARVLVGVRSRARRRGAPTAPCDAPRGAHQQQSQWRQRRRCT